MDPIVKVEGLHKTYGKTIAVDEVSFEVSQGEIFGMAGPNGAGKSTLFNVITGIYPPTSGKVYFLGQDVTPLRPHEICLRGIGRTYQIPAAFHTMTVYDNIRIGSIFGSQGRRKVSDILDFLNRALWIGRRKIDLVQQR